MNKTQQTVQYDLQLQGIGMTSQRTRQRLIQRLVSQGVSNETVLNLILKIPRHLFLEEALSHHAYEDVALPIGYKQTLSQPYVVARMTEIIIDAASQLNRVLEIGTGSGYQTAILSKIVDELHTVERIKSLRDRACQITRKLGIYNVRFYHTDGNFGLPKLGPFNAILSTAAAKRVPADLKQQLATDGVLLIPVGEHKQMLVLIVRKGDSDEFLEEELESVKFVPLLKGIIN